MAIWYLIVVLLIPSMASLEKHRSCNEQPPTIPNTYITTVGLQEYKHGTVLQYKCGQAFDQSGRNSYVTCEDGQWIGASGNMIRCIPGHCTQIYSREIDNGRVKNISGVVGTYAEFECYDGYELYGSAQILCMADRKWHPEIPTCKPISCPKPTQIINGKLTEEDYNGVRNTFQSTIRYECNKGYKMVGSQFRRCQSDRTWSGNDTKCEIILCENPSPPENGRVYLTDNSEKVGSQIEYICDEHYTLVPKTSQFAICTEYGHWSQPKPLCRKMCTVRALSNGSIRRTLGFGTKINNDIFVENNIILFFSCDIGYEAYSNGYVTDGKLKCVNGTMSPGSPECRPARCFLDRSDALDYFIDQKRILDEYVYDGTLMQAGCPDKMELVRTSSYVDREQVSVKCNFGNLEPGSLTCRKKRCNGSNTTIKNGQLRASGRELLPGYRIPSGSNIQVICSDGYELYNESKAMYMDSQHTVIICNQGSFIPELPTCEPKRCFIEVQVNLQFLNGEKLVEKYVESGTQMQASCPAEMELVYSSSYLDLEQVSVNCNFGILDLGSRKCVEKRCIFTIETTENRKFMSKGKIIEAGERILSGSYIQVKCSNEYDLFNESTSMYIEGKETDIKCYQGSFMPDIPTCKPAIARCVLKDAGMHFISLGSKTVATVGELVNVSCRSGYQSVLSDKDENAYHFDYFDSESATHSYQKAEEDNNKTVGLVLDGLHKCGNNGTWEPEISFSCKHIICESFDDYSLENGNIIYSSLNPYSIGTVATFRCNPGYHLNGPENRTCQTDGTWLGTCATCESNSRNRSITCPAPCIPDGARKTGSHTYEIGSIIKFYCPRSKTHQRAESRHVRHCIKTGDYATWNGTQINCKEKCKSPVLTDNMTGFKERGTKRNETNDFYLHDESIEIVCREGYIQQGTLTCNDGAWIGNSTCELVKCESLSDDYEIIKIGVVQGTLSQMTKVKISCNKSQAPFNDEKQATCKGGSWTPRKPYCANTCSVPSLPGTLYNYNISNNTVLPGPVSSGRKVKVTCEEGYNSVSYGSNVSTCTNGIWEPALSHCEKKVECDSLSDNFKVIKVGVIQGKLSHQTIVEISCNKSQSPFDDVKKATCNEAFWKPWKPYCANTCSMLPLPGTLYKYNITNKMVLPGPVSSGRKIKVTCEEGYNSVLHSSNVSTCTNGIWEPALSRCERKDCPKGKIHWNSTSYRKGPKKYISYRTYLTEIECFSSCEKDQSCKAVYMNAITSPPTLHCKLFALNTKDMPQEFTRSGVETETIYDKACVEASERDVPIK